MKKRLYDVLGLNPEASAAEIKSAYRRKAKTAHPDAGGNAADFADLSKAFSILSDEQRRISYDATGDENDAPRAEDAAMVIFRNLVEMVISGNDDPAFVDFAAMMKGKIADALIEARGQIAQVQKNVKRCEQMAARFSRKGGETLVTAMITARMRDMQHQIATWEKQIETLEKVKAMVAEYSYRADVRSATMSYQNTMAQAMAQTNSPWRAF